jgi:hypothetical protein
VITVIFSIPCHQLQCAALYRLHIIISPLDGPEIEHFPFRSNHRVRRIVRFRMCMVADGLILSYACFLG